MSHFRRSTSLGRGQSSTGTWLGGAVAGQSFGVGIISHQRSRPEASPVPIQRTRSGAPVLLSVQKPSRGVTLVSIITAILLPVNSYLILQPDARTLESVRAIVHRLGLSPQPPSPSAEAAAHPVGTLPSYEADFNLTATPIEKEIFKRCKRVISGEEQSAKISDFTPKLWEAFQELEGWQAVRYEHELWSPPLQAFSQNIPKAFLRRQGFHYLHPISLLSS